MDYTLVSLLKERFGFRGPLKQKTSLILGSNRDLFERLENILRNYDNFLGSLGLGRHQF